MTGQRYAIRCTATDLDQWLQWAIQWEPNHPDRATACYNRCIAYIATLLYDAGPGPIADDLRTLREYLYTKAI